MNTPTAAEAQTVSTANNEALTNAANDLFIINANLQIANAELLGHFFVQCEKRPHVDFAYIISYYRGLGYNVYVPFFTVGNPAQLVGTFWDDYWQAPNAISLISRKKDLITISWLPYPVRPIF
jgi:hypothetical protein